jgi:hypothetical protein
MNSVRISGKGSHTVTRVEYGSEILVFMLSVRQGSDFWEIETKIRQSYLIRRFCGFEGGKTVIVTGCLCCLEDNIFVEASHVELAPAGWNTNAKETECSISH